MDTEKLLYLIPYILSFGLSLGILVYAWIKPNIRSAREFGLYMFGQTLWLFGFLMEIIYTDILTKIFWDKFQWIAAVIVLITLPFFVVRYLNFKPKRSGLIIGVLLIVPFIFILAVLTDPYHHLLYPDPLLVSGKVFSELTYHFTWLVYSFALYSYLVSIGAIVILIWQSTKTDSLHRSQLLTIAVGVLIPILGTMAALAGIHIITQRDPSPLTTAIGNFVIAWGLFRYRIFDFRPIARDTIFENMDDIVVVMDAQNRIVDINKSALKYLNLERARTIGMPAESVLADWSKILEKFDPPGNINTEIYYQAGEKYYHYDIKSTVLYDESGVYQGRIFVTRDITSYAELQWKLETLKDNLEKRVAEQTKEIFESYETTLEGWAKALELRDKETEGHSRRVIDETVQLARALRIPENEIEHIRRGAILHDIGKMGIPDEILRKATELNDEERHIIEKHPETARHLLESIPYLQKAIDIPYCHQERWNGSGYPRGLKGEEIPLAARIFAVVDVWDALLSDRIYCKAWQRTEAIQYIGENSGTLFDPWVVDAFLEMVREKSI